MIEGNTDQNSERDEGFAASAEGAVDQAGASGSTLVRFSFMQI